MADGDTELGFIDKEGTFGDMTKAPDNVREFVAKKGFKSIGEMTSAQVELEGMLGQREKLITVPESGDVDGWGKFYDRMGRPAKAEDYAFTARDGDPKAEGSLITMFKEYAYGKGWNQDAFQETVNFQMDAIKAADQVYAQEVLDQRNLDQKAIRGRFDTEEKYNEFTQKGMAFAEKFKLDENKSVMDVLVDKGLAHDPVVLDMMGQLSDRTVEDPLGERTRSKAVNKDDRIREIQKDPAFTNVMDPNHYPIMKEYHALFAPQETRQEG